MKTKYLLPMLAGLALASCNSEDDFSAINTKQDYSPITFGVTKDDAGDPLTRATINGSVVNFGAGDYISMFNGMAIGIGSPDYNITAIGQNAIFEGVGEEGALVFKTKSMIKEGKAILVYPADTTFTNSDKITIGLALDKSDVQTNLTKLSQPYMSDVINIAAYSSDAPANSAGYGRRYDVPLKKVGSLLSMTIDAKNKNKITDIEGVADIVVKKVTIDAGKDAFNKTVTVASSATKPSLAENDKAENSDPVAFAHLTNVTDVVDGTQVQTISSGDISGDICYFTLLPQVGNIDLSAQTPTVKVETNYGSVTVTETVGEYPLVKDKEDTKTLKVALADILNNTWADNISSKNFKGEKTGANFKRTLTIDMQNLDMNGTNISTSAELIDVLKVYHALGITSSVTFNLEGGALSRFEMTGAALDKLIAVNGGKTITLNANGNSIILADAGATTGKVNNENVVLTGTKANIVLGANVDWTIDQAIEDTHITSISNEGKLTITNSTETSNALVISLNNAATGKILFGSAQVTLGDFTTDAGSNVTIASGKTVYLGGTTTLSGDIENHGILSAKGVVINQGYIDNQFEISVLKGGLGSILNIGTIKNNGTNAVTYITENQNSANMGKIILTNRNDEVSVKENVNKPGYICYTMTAIEGKYDFTAKPTDKFNWLTIDTTASAEDVVDVTINSNVAYLELLGKTVNVSTTGTITVTDLFVKNSMRLLGDNALTATNIYVVDYILHSGHLTGGQAKSYDSKVYGSVADIETYANGVIRTVGQ